MLVNPFPSLGTPVSRLGYGAFGLGGVFGAFDKTEAIDAMHAAWDRGVNLIDTARHYGASESIIAEAMQSWRGQSRLSQPRPSASARSSSGHSRLGRALFSARAHHSRGGYFP